MQNRNNLKRPHGAGVASPLACGTRLRLGRACVSLAFVAAFACVAQESRAPGGAPVEAQTPLNTPPDANTQIQNQDDKDKPKSLDSGNGDRKKQIVDDSTRLLNMAIALKAEVDKTTKDTLSLNVIRKADEIEKLARNVKEKMKQAVGPG